MESNKKQVEAFKALKSITQKLAIMYAIPENKWSKEAKNNLNKIKKIEKAIDRENSYFKTAKNTYNFKTFRAISTFGRNIYSGTITKEKFDKDQSDLLFKILNFKKKVKPRNPGKKNQKKMLLKLIASFWRWEKEFLMFLTAIYFQ